MAVKHGNIEVPRSTTRLWNDAAMPESYKLRDIAMKQVPQHAVALARVDLPVTAITQAAFVIG